MRFLKSLAGSVSTLARWVIGQVQIVRGRDSASLGTRLISAITLASIVMVIVFAAKLILAQSRVSVTLATAGQGGEYYEFGEDLKRVINDNQRRIRVETIPTLGSYQNMQLLDDKDVDLAIVQHDTRAKPSVQAVASLFPEMLLLIVDHNINDICDLKDKRIAVIPNLLGEAGDPNDPDSFFHRFIESHGLEGAIDPVKKQSILEARAAFLSNEIDAIILFISVGNKTICELLKQNHRPAQLLSINVHAIENWHPYVEEATIYAGACHGNKPIHDKNIPTASVQALLLTRKTVDESIIQSITRILYEHRNKLMAENPRAATIELPNSGENLGIPLHVGAKSYYRREEPGFLVTYSDPLTLFLSLSMLCVSGMWHLRLRLVQLQKNRADKYNLEILNLVEQSRRIQNPYELQEVRQKLLEIFRRVLEDLDRDRISADSFQLFTFPLEVALGSVRHQEWILMSLPPKMDMSKGQSTEKQKE